MKWENSSEQDETPGDSYSLQRKYQFSIFKQISNEEFLNALFTKQIYPWEWICICNRYNQFIHQIIDEYDHLLKLFIENCCFYNTVLLCKFDILIAVILLVSSLQDLFNYKAICLPLCGNMYSSRIAGLCHLFHEYRGFDFFSFFFLLTDAKIPQGTLKQKRNTLCKFCFDQGKLSTRLNPCICFVQRVGGTWTIDSRVSPALVRRIIRTETVMTEEWKCKQVFTARNRNGWTSTRNEHCISRLLWRVRYKINGLFRLVKI